jgi:hypothetical protein
VVAQDRRRAGGPDLPDLSTFLVWPRGIARLGVVLCVALALGYGLVYFVKAVDRLGDDARDHAALNFDDREFAGGNALVSNAPLYEARALIPENETYRYVVGAGLEGEDATRAIQVGDYLRYFLMPRRPAADAPWVFCYACDPAELGEGVEILYQDAERILIGRAAL